MNAKPWLCDSEKAPVARGCPACQAEQIAGARFCRGCGSQLRLLPATNVETVVPVADEDRGTGPSPIPDSELPKEPEPQRETLPAHKDAADSHRPVPGNNICTCCGQPVSNMPKRHRLVLLNGNKTVFDIEQDEMILGKDPACDVVLPHDAYISRRHARLTRANDLFFLEDLGSANGTLLRIKRSIALDIGDEIVLGATVLRLEQVTVDRKNS